MQFCISILLNKNSQALISDKFIEKRLDSDQFRDFSAVLGMYAHNESERVEQVRADELKQRR